jgi:hypothetical protein
MTKHARGLRVSWLVLVLSVMGTAGLRGQDPRDALVTRAFNEFEAARRLQLLMGALNPTAGPPRGSWPVGLQLLAQTLIDEGQDSLAAVWLRWAIRLSPDLQPDTVQFLPRVVTAYRAARTFVQRTRVPADSAAATTWLWPAQDMGQGPGGIQVASFPAPMRLEIVGVGLVAPGNRSTLAAGSYEIAASATGYDSLRVTREVLPGVTTVLDFRLRSRTTQIATQPRPTPTTTPTQQAIVPKPKGKGLPMWVKIGAAGGIAWAIAWNAYIKSH